MTTLCVVVSAWDWATDKKNIDIHLHNVYGPAMPTVLQMRQNSSYHGGPGPERMTGKNVSNTEFFFCLGDAQSEYIQDVWLWAYVGVRSVPLGLPSGCGWVWGSRWCPGLRRAGWHRAPGAQTAWRTGRWLSGTPPRRYTVRGEVDVVTQRQRRHQRQEGNVCNVQKWSN